LIAPTFANGPDLPWSSIDECKPVLLVHDCHGDHDFTGRFDDVTEKELDEIRFQRPGGTCEKLSILNALSVSHAEQFPLPPFGGKSQVLDWLADVYAPRPGIFAVPIGVSGGRGKDLLSYYTDSVLPRLCNPNEIVAIEKYGTKFTPINIPDAGLLSESNVQLLTVIDSLLKIRLGPLMNFVEHVSELTETHDERDDEEVFIKKAPKDNDERNFHGIPIDSAVLLKILDPKAKSNRSTSSRTIDDSTPDETPDKPVPKDVTSTDNRSRTDSLDTVAALAILDNIKRMAKTIEVPGASDGDASVERGRPYLSPLNSSSTAPSDGKPFSEVAEDISYLKELDTLADFPDKEESISPLLHKSTQQLLTPPGGVSLLPSFEQVIKVGSFSHYETQGEERQAISHVLEAGPTENSANSTRPVTAFLSKLLAVRKSDFGSVKTKQDHLFTTASSFVKGITELDPFVRLTTCSSGGPQNERQSSQLQTAGGPIEYASSPAKLETLSLPRENVLIVSPKRSYLSLENSDVPGKTEDGNPAGLNELQLSEANQLLLQGQAAPEDSQHAKTWLMRASDGPKTPVGRPIPDDERVRVELPAGAMRKTIRPPVTSEPSSPTEQMLLQRAHYKMAKACGLSLDVQLANNFTQQVKMPDYKGKTPIRPNQDPFGMEPQSCSPLSDYPTQSPTPLPRDENEATFQDTRAPWLLGRMTGPLMVTEMSQYQNSLSSDKTSQSSRNPPTNNVAKAENPFDQESVKKIFSDTAMVNCFRQNCSQGVRHSTTIPPNRGDTPGGNGRSNYIREFTMRTRSTHTSQSSSFQPPEQINRDDTRPSSQQNSITTRQSLVQNNGSVISQHRQGPSRPRQLTAVQTLLVTDQTARGPPPGLGYSTEAAAAGPAQQPTSGQPPDYSELLSNLRDTRLPPDYPTRLPTGRPPTPHDHTIHPIDMPQWSEAHQAAIRAENVNGLPEPAQYRPVPRLRPPPGINIPVTQTQLPRERDYLEELSQRIHYLEGAVRYHSIRANNAEYAYGVLHREGQRLAAKVEEVQQRCGIYENRVWASNARATAAETDAARLREENQELRNECDSWEVHYQFALQRGLSASDFGM
jgi:hypothetical protein